MQIFTKLIAVGTVATLLGGCMSKPDLLPHGQRSDAQNSAFITMKTPVFRYADQGFIHKEPAETKIEIYSSGNPVMKLTINSSQICSGSGLFSCLSKGEFNKRYLSMYYPDDTLESIFLAKPVFASVGLEQTSKGFIQKIKKPLEYNIRYSVSGKNILFRDTINNIVIKVRENR